MSTPPFEPALEAPGVFDQHKHNQDRAKAVAQGLNGHLQVALLQIDLLQTKAAKGQVDPTELKAIIERSYNAMRRAKALVAVLSDFPPDTSVFSDR